MRIDPVTLQIFANHAQAAADSMAFTLFRTAYSTFVKETEDFTIQILDANGKTCAAPIDLGATCLVVFAGHALRLEISSSNFPRFDVNPNSSRPVAEATAVDFVIARQRVYHDRLRPSRLELVTVPRPERGGHQRQLFREA